MILLCSNLTLNRRMSEGKNFIKQLLELHMLAKYIRITDVQCTLYRNIDMFLVDTQELCYYLYYAIILVIVLVPV